MGLLNVLQNFAQNTIGSVNATASTGGSVNGKLLSLMPYVVGTTGTVLVYPSTSSPTAASPPNATWGTSGFTTILSSGTLSSHMLTGYWTNAVRFQSQIDIASGVSGAEVVKFSARVGHIGLSMVFPPIQWPANERVSFRVSGNSTASAIQVAPTFAQRPI